MGTGWSSSANRKKNQTNFGRLCKLLIEVGTLALRDFFNSIHPAQSLQASLKEPKNYGVLSSLKIKDGLLERQWHTLYPSDRSAVTSNEFDIKLLSLLVWTICDLTELKTECNRPPLIDDFSREADLIRLKFLRNKIRGHGIPEREISDSDFETYWNEIEVVIVRLCGEQYKPEIDRLKLISVNAKDEKYYVQCLEEWDDHEERWIKVLKEIKAEKNGELDRKEIDDLQSINTKNASKDSPEMKITSEDAELYTKNFKLSIQSQTRNLPKYNSTMMENMKTEEIFPNILITDNPKPSKKDPTASENDPTGFSLQKCQDIFMNNNGENPKKILVFAEQGKGKTFFCLKLVRDWSKDGISDKDSKRLEFKLVFFLTFRQLNLIDEDLNLSELLNLSSLLDSKSMTSDSIIEYFAEHAERILIVIDGVDEYKNRDKIGSADYEGAFPNDAKTRMPVAALCSKLIQSKILKGSVIMVTSRPDDDQQIMYKDHFDRYLEIAEFNEQGSTSKRLYNAVQLW